MSLSGLLKPLRDIMPFYELLKRSNGKSHASIESITKNIPANKAIDQQVNKAAENKEDIEEIVLRLRLTNKLLAYNISNFEIVIDNLNDGVIVLDSSGRVLAINHIMEQILNLKRGEIKSKYIKDCQGNNAIFNFMLENYESIGKLVEKTADINLGPSSIRVSYKTLIRGDGNSAGSLLIARDITSQKLAELAKIEFLSHVSHELKAPLNTIKGYTELLIDGDLKNREAIIEFCNTVNEEADRLSNLINNLLHLSKIEMGGLTLSRSMTRTGEFIENIFKIAISQKKKGIKYELIIPDKIPPVSIDKEFMGIVLINLIGNAIKYTPELGKVTLRVEEEGDNLIISVIDTGIGISEEDLPHIFEKFYRSSDEMVRTQTGHGLGLAIAKQIVELHGGDIKVISKKGAGSQFSIVLPIEDRYFLE